MGKKDGSRGECGGLPVTAWSGIGNLRVAIPPHVAKGVSDLLRSGTASLREILSEAAFHQPCGPCGFLGDFFAIDEDFVADVFDRVLAAAVRAGEPLDGCRGKIDRAVNVLVERNVDVLDVLGERAASSRIFRVLDRDIPFHRERSQVLDLGSGLRETLTLVSISSQSLGLEGLCLPPETRRRKSSNVGLLAVTLKAWPWALPIDKLAMIANAVRKRDFEVKCVHTVGV
jgi:hypothetical protein